MFPSRLMSLLVVVATSALAGPAAPIDATLSSEPLAGNRIRVTLTIVEHSGLHAPMTVKATAPEGVSVEGELSAVLPAADGPVSRELSWVLTVRDVVPAGDFAVSVEARGQSWGFHFSDAYRFGREPLAPHAVVRDEPVRFRGPQVGRSVRIH